MPLGQHRLGPGDLSGDLFRVDRSGVDARGGFVFRSVERYVVQIGGFQPVEVVGLAEGPVVPVHHLHRDEEQVVRQSLPFEEVDRVDLELVGVHVGFHQLDGTGVARGLVGGIARDHRAGNGRGGEQRRDGADKRFSHISLWF